MTMYSNDQWPRVHTCHIQVHTCHIQVHTCHIQVTQRAYSKVLFSAYDPDKKCLSHPDERVVCHILSDTVPERVVCDILTSESV